MKPAQLAETGVWGGGGVREAYVGAAGAIVLIVNIHRNAGDVA